MGAGLPHQHAIQPVSTDFMIYFTARSMYEAWAGWCSIDHRSAIVLCHMGVRRAGAQSCMSSLGGEFDWGSCNEVEGFVTRWDGYRDLPAHSGHRSVELFTYGVPKPVAADNLICIWVVGGWAGGCVGGGVALMHMHRSKIRHVSCNPFPPWSFHPFHGKLNRKITNRTTWMTTRKYMEYT